MNCFFYNWMDYTFELFYSIASSKRNIVYVNFNFMAYICNEKCITFICILLNSFYLKLLNYSIFFLITYVGVISSIFLHSHPINITIFCYGDANYRSDSRPQNYDRTAPNNGSVLSWLSVYLYIHIFLSISIYMYI